MREGMLALVLAGAIVAPAPALAQTDEQVNKYMEMARTDVKRDKTAIIGAAMGFTGEEAAKFWPVYKEYEAELSKVGDERLSLIKEYAASFQTMTDAKAAELTAKALEQEQKRLDLLKKYDARLAKEMSPVVAARFLQVENRLNLLLDLQVASQIPLIHKAGM